MKTFVFVTTVSNEKIYTCLTSSEEDAWGFFSEVKRLPVTELKKIFKLKC